MSKPDAYPIRDLANFTERYMDLLPEAEDSPLFLYVRGERDAGSPSPLRHITIDKRMARLGFVLRADIEAANQETIEMLLHPQGWFTFQGWVTSSASIPFPSDDMTNDIKKAVRDVFPR